MKRKNHYLLFLLFAGILLFACAKTETIDDRASSKEGRNFSIAEAQSFFEERLSAYQLTKTAEQ